LHLTRIYSCKFVQLSAMLLRGRG